MYIVVPSDVVRVCVSVSEPICVCKCEGVSYA